MLDVNLIMASVAELMGTFILVLIGRAIATAVIPNREMAGQGDDPLAIAMWSGLALTGIVSALGRVNGRAGNPARGFGPMVVSGTWDRFLNYLIGSRRRWSHRRDRLRPFRRPSFATGHGCLWRTSSGCSPQDRSAESIAALEPTPGCGSRSGSSVLSIDGPLRR